MLTIYNTLSRTKEVFTPIEAGKVADVFAERPEPVHARIGERAVIVVLTDQAAHDL